jgi:VanZ family protein
MVFPERKTNMKKGKIILITVLICFLYAVSDEIHQSFVPGRACRLFDIFIDTSGSVFFCLIYYILSKTGFRKFL